jgi:hypothetical protein
MKEINIIANDAGSAESLKQLDQVIEFGYALLSKYKQFFCSN